MDSFVVAARVVVPMALTMGLGVLLRITGLTDRDTMRKVDVIIYNIFSSFLIFYNVYYTDFADISHPGALVYSLVGLVLMFLAALFLPRIWVKERATAASFGQGIFRTNFVIFGAAVATSIYGAGNIGVVLMMGAVTVPPIVAMCVAILEVGRQGSSLNVKSLTVSLVKNPIIIGTVLGLAANFLNIRVPDLIMGVVEDVANLTTPMSFLSIGVSLQFGKLSKQKILGIALLIRLLLMPLVLVSGAILLGFRGIELCALMVLFAGPAAVNSYPTAVAMGADGDFAGQFVAVSTICSLFTIFLWTLALNSLGML